MTAQGNMAYWLGIYKNNTCKLRLVEDLENVTEIKMNKCAYLQNSTYTFDDCNEINHAICVRPGENIFVLKVNYLTKFNLICFQNEY